MIVAEPEPDVPLISDNGIWSVPARVPPDNVMVKGALSVVLAPIETVALNVPLPTPERLAVPVAVMLVPVKLAVEFTVKVVFTVAAPAKPAAAAKTIRTIRKLFKFSSEKNENAITNYTPALHR